MSKLDLIVTHYNEPWETGAKFFAMLDLQRDIHFDDIHVIVINDGEDCALPEEHFVHRPYTVEQITIPHGGISAARNAGIKAATAEWIAFCDFDDMYANAYALRDVLNVLPATGYDMLWTEFISEDRMKDGAYRLHMRGENQVFIHGRFFRRQTLLDLDLWFDTELKYNEDSAFVTIFNVLVDYKRTGKIKCTAPCYIWCFTENSLTTKPGNNAKAMQGAYYRNKKVCEAFKRRLPHDRYCNMIARTFIDTYYTLNIHGDLPPELLDVKADFKRFYTEHKAEYAEVPKSTLREIKAVSRAEHTRGEQEAEERWAIDHVDKVDESINVTTWLANLEAEINKEIDGKGGMTRV